MEHNLSNISENNKSYYHGQIRNDIQQKDNVIEVKYTEIPQCGQVKRDG